MKQAVVILHGMGEQIPMQTLNAFVTSVWTEDTELVDRERRDPNTGGPRTHNVSWAKPDPRNSSSELRRITTERDNAGNYTDFFEYYWAHMMQGTTWEHVQTWIKDLLLRNPRTRVPRRMLHAWILLWIVALVVVGFTLWGLWPKTEAPKPWLSVLSALGGMAVSAFVSTILIKRFGDVARYVKAWPPNVAKRQIIRQTGVDLLNRLIQSGEYERIIVVAHSLGTIVAYDILSMLYAQYNTGLDGDKNADMPQPERDRMEQMLRVASEGGTPLDLDAFQAQQAKVMAEAKAQGAKWNISDFITLGSPLTHAEFLMAESRDDLRARQDTRLLPTCPPVLEYDGTTKLRHFTYSEKTPRKPLDRRLPHHAALFAYTRWTNLYSPEMAIVTGDLVSGPLSDVFGHATPFGVLSGIRDVAVLPKMEDGTVAPGHRRSFVSHNNYWKLNKGTEITATDAPHHIAELRRALQILQ